MFNLRRQRKKSQKVPKNDQGKQTLCFDTIAILDEKLASFIQNNIVFLSITTESIQTGMHMGHKMLIKSERDKQIFNVSNDLPVENKDDVIIYADLCYRQFASGKYTEHKIAHASFDLSRPLESKNDDLMKIPLSLNHISNRKGQTVYKNQNCVSKITPAQNGPMIIGHLQVYIKEDKLENNYQKTRQICIFIQLNGPSFDDTNLDKYVIEMSIGNIIQNYQQVAERGGQWPLTKYFVLDQTVLMAKENKHPLLVKFIDYNEKAPSLIGYTIIPLGNLYNTININSNSHQVLEIESGIFSIKSVEEDIPLGSIQVFIHLAIIFDLQQLNSVISEISDKQITPPNVLQQKSTQVNQDNQPQCSQKAVQVTEQIIQEQSTMPDQKKSLLAYEHQLDCDTQSVSFQQSQTEIKEAKNQPQQDGGDEEQPRSLTLQKSEKVSVCTNNSELQKQSYSVNSAVANQLYSKMVQQAMSQSRNQTNIQNKQNYANTALGGNKVYESVFQFLEAAQNNQSYLSYIFDSTEAGLPEFRAVLNHMVSDISQQELQQLQKIFFGEKETLFTNNCISQMIEKMTEAKYKLFKNDIQALMGILSQQQLIIIKTILNDISKINKEISIETLHQKFNEHNLQLNITVYEKIGNIGQCADSGKILLSNLSSVFSFLNNYSNNFKGNRSQQNFSLALSDMMQKNSFIKVNSFKLQKQIYDDFLSKNYSQQLQENVNKILLEECSDDCPQFVKNILPFFSSNDVINILELVFFFLHLNTDNDKQGLSSIDSNIVSQIVNTDNKEQIAQVEHIFQSRHKFSQFLKQRNNSPKSQIVQNSQIAHEQEYDQKHPQDEKDTSMNNSHDKYCINETNPDQKLKSQQYMIIKYFKIIQCSSELLGKQFVLQIYNSDQPGQSRESKKFQITDYNETIELQIPIYNTFESYCDFDILLVMLKEQGGQGVNIAKCKFSTNELLFEHGGGDIAKRFLTCNDYQLFIISQLVIEVTQRTKEGDIVYQEPNTQQDNNSYISHLKQYVNKDEKNYLQEYNFDRNIQDNYSQKLKNSQNTINQSEPLQILPFIKTSTPSIAQTERKDYIQQDEQQNDNTILRLKEEEMNQLKNTNQHILDSLAFKIQNLKISQHALKMINLGQNKAQQENKEIKHELILRVNMKRTLDIVIIKKQTQLSLQDKLFKIEGPICEKDLQNLGIHLLLKGKGNGQTEVKDICYQKLDLVAFSKQENLKAFQYEIILRQAESELVFLQMNFLREYAQNKINSFIVPDDKISPKKQLYIYPLQVIGYNNILQQLNNFNFSISFNNGKKLKLSFKSTPLQIISQISSFNIESIFRKKNIMIIDDSDDLEIVVQINNTETKETISISKAFLKQQWFSDIHQINQLHVCFKGIIVTFGVITSTADSMNTFDQFGSICDFISSGFQEEYIKTLTQKNSLFHISNDEMQIFIEEDQFRRLCLKKKAFVNTQLDSILGLFPKQLIDNRIHYNISSLFPQCDIQFQQLINQQGLSNDTITKFIQNIEYYDNAQNGVLSQTILTSIIKANDQLFEQKAFDLDTHSLQGQKYKNSYMPLIHALLNKYTHTQHQNTFKEKCLVDGGVQTSKITIPQNEQKTPIFSLGDYDQKISITFSSALFTNTQTLIGNSPLKPNTFIQTQFLSKKRTTSKLNVCNSTPDFQNIQKCSFDNPCEIMQLMNFQNELQLYQKVFTQSKKNFCKDKLLLTIKFKLTQFFTIEQFLSFMEKRNQTMHKIYDLEGNMYSLQIQLRKSSNNINDISDVEIQNTLLTLSELKNDPFTHTLDDSQNFLNDFVKNDNIIGEVYQGGYKELDNYQIDQKNNFIDESLYNIKKVNQRNSKEGQDTQIRQQKQAEKDYDINLLDFEERVQELLGPTEQGDRRRNLGVPNQVDMTQQIIDKFPKRLFSPLEICRIRNMMNSDFDIEDIFDFDLND